MKKTWIVTVGAGVGHEYHNDLSETELYGPYTERDAEALAKALNGVYEDTGDEEYKTATAVPLDTLSPARVLRMEKDLAERYTRTGEVDDE